MNEHIRVHLGTGIPSTDEAVGYVGDDAAGGIAVFAGTTRRITDGRETRDLHYEAYEDMARAQMEKLATEALQQWHLEKVLVAHRLGRVPHGEVSVLIAVSAAHRAPAFEACRFLIDSVKSQVPIWKKETFADGDSEWVQGTMPDLS